MDTITVKLNIYTDEHGFVNVVEHKDSAVKRIADAFGFDAKRIEILDDEEHSVYYNGSLVEECYIRVCGTKYRIKFDYKNGENDIYIW